MTRDARERMSVDLFTRGAANDVTGEDEDPTVMLDRVIERWEEAIDDLPEPVWAELAKAMRAVYDAHGSEAV